MSAQPSHQTVRLCRGKHSSPAQGVCVMELASMLAGEPFSDRPACVDPVIGGFLRAYNDTVDRDRRQDLYAVAARVVGTAAGEDVEQARAARCIAFAEAHRRRPRWAGNRRRRPLALAAHLGKDGPGVLAVRSLGRIDDARHAAALSLVDELIALQDTGLTRKPTSEPRPRVNVPVARDTVHGAGSRSPAAARKRRSNEEVSAQLNEELLSGATR
jgi:hypothetical protein